jgi:NADPH-dependent 2,4-dienoyl-CoA reductase/sulfur reductase-like enzyme
VSWIPQTDGLRVWARDAETGAIRRYSNTSSSPVVDVFSIGDEVAIVTQDGRTRAWNPETDSSRTFL